jgi:hypothetical protein
VPSGAVEPQLENVLLTDVHRVTQGVVVDLVAVPLAHRDQFQLAGKIWDRGGVRVEYHLDKGCTITLTIEEVLLDENSSAEIDIRSLEH